MPSVWHHLQAHDSPKQAYIVLPQRPIKRHRIQLGRQRRRKYHLPDAEFIVAGLLGSYVVAAAAIHLANDHFILEESVTVYV